MNTIIYFIIVCVCDLLVYFFDIVPIHCLSCKILGHVAKECHKCFKMQGAIRAGTHTGDLRCRLNLGSIQSSAGVKYSGRGGHIALCCVRSNAVLYTLAQVEYRWKAQGYSVTDSTVVPTRKLNTKKAI